MLMRDATRAATSSSGDSSDAQAPHACSSGDGSSSVASWLSSNEGGMKCPRRPARRSSSNVTTPGPEKDNSHLAHSSAKDIPVRALECGARHHHPGARVFRLAQSRGERAKPLRAMICSRVECLTTCAPRFRRSDTHRLRQTRCRARGRAPKADQALPHPETPITT